MGTISETSNDNVSTSNDKAEADRQALKQQVNDLELKYYDKQEVFWQRMFTGCTGFVAIVMPLSIRIDMSREVRWCILGAVASAAICALCNIPLLYSTVRRHKELFEHGRNLARGETNTPDYSPQDSTLCERCFKAAAFVSIAVAMACLVATCLLSA